MYEVYPASATDAKPKPPVKWAGGKGQLIPQFVPLFPKESYELYLEPFVGGGAVFFYLSSIYIFEEIILNDINCECILTYKVVQQYVDGGKGG
ncbi:MAG: DNA adenine methylase [Peptococcaceae bacterium]|nr:DNA adenine methylase [Peptococcaceae bacterium]